MWATCLGRQHEARLAAERSEDPSTTPARPAIELVREALAERPSTRAHLTAATGLSDASLTRALGALGANSTGSGGHAGGKVWRLGDTAETSS